MEGHDGVLRVQGQLQKALPGHVVGDGGPAHFDALHNRPVCVRHIELCAAQLQIWLAAAEPNQRCLPLLRRVTFDQRAEDAQRER